MGLKLGMKSDDNHFPSSGGPKVIEIRGGVKSLYDGVAVEIIEGLTGHTGQPPKTIDPMFTEMLDIRIINGVCICMD